MLIITRKYTIGVNLKFSEDFEAKVRELRILVMRTNTMSTTVHDTKMSKRYYECMSTEEKMNELIGYLKSEFKGSATIIY